MKTHLLFSGALLLSLLQPGHAAEESTIDPQHAYAYGANIGWVNARPSAADGAVIGEFVCAGKFYSANCGWISLGDGTPANLRQYQNNSAADFGVNHLGDGRLRGYAWGANIGWIAFEESGNPRLNLLTGNLSGSVWSANCGWISLSNAVAHVRTTKISPGTDSDSDGMPDGWELGFSPNLNSLGAGEDSDGDGAPDTAEYAADTNPLNPDDLLRITDIQYNQQSKLATLTWLSKSTRLYGVISAPDVAGLSGPDSYMSQMSPGNAGSTTRAFFAVAPTAFYRVKAQRPLE